MNGKRAKTLRKIARDYMPIDNPKEVDYTVKKLPNKDTVQVVLHPLCVRAEYQEMKKSWKNK
jgi:hypothetical protein